MNNYVLHGAVCHCPEMGRLETLESGWIPVTDGLCRGLFPVLPEAYAGLPVLDFGDRLILPGLTDLHLHAPQYAFRGLGMDLELLDWLNTHTFPEEAKYRDLAYADRAYDVFTRALNRSFTTRAAIFATSHRPATELLMDKLENTGLITRVGKVNMDRNCPPGVREASAAAALADTEAWLRENLDRRVRTKPILTPRFIPACSDELLTGLGRLQKEYGVGVQSHLSENLGEIQLVRTLCPEAGCYGAAYAQFGLFGNNGPCIMAHCVHSGPEELELMGQTGVWIAHSPESNMNLASGVAPISRYLDLGLRVGLATDVAGGSSLNMLRAVGLAIQASKLRWRLLDDSVAPLSLERAFSMATLGGGSFFGRVGAFLEGYELDALVLDDTALEHPQPLTARERLERAVYLADDRCLAAKFVAGRRMV